MNASTPISSKQVTPSPILVTAFLVAKVEEPDINSHKPMPLAVNQL